MTITIVVENVPANVEWQLRTSNNNGFDSTTGTGSGTFTRTFIAAELGSDTVTLEVDGVVSASVTIIVTGPAPSGSITAPALCVFGGPGAAITVVVENVPASVEWKLRSAIGNGFDNHGTGSGTFNRFYVPANEPGQDTITVEVDGVVLASAQILIVGASLGASPLTIEFGQSSTLTIIFELLPADKEWTLRSTKGNTFDSTKGTGNRTFTRLYVASIATGKDTVILEVDGVYMYEVPIQVN